jgi:hypothetical protein
MNDKQFWHKIQYNQIKTAVNDFVRDCKRITRNIDDIVGEEVIAHMDNGSIKRVIFERTDRDQDGIRRMYDDNGKRIRRIICKSDDDKAVDIVLSYFNKLNNPWEGE